MTTTQLVQLAAAALLFIAGVVQYRRRAKDGSSYGSQSAMLLFAAGAIFLVLGLGLLDYRPSPSEIGQ
jgi:hypothetical protein